MVRLVQVAATEDTPAAPAPPCWPQPASQEECANLEKESDETTTWIPADQLTGIGDFACGNVVTGAGQGVLVTVLSRRGDNHVSIALGRTPGDVTTVRTAVLELAKAVMQRV